jgi:hypothetical protein
VNGSPPLPANGDALDSGSRGHEFYSGCSRAKLYEWAAKGFIRSVSIREPGRIKGVRLFHLASILAFIERCEIEAKSNLNDTGK